MQPQPTCSSHSGPGVTRASFQSGHKPSQTPGPHHCPSKPSPAVVARGPLNLKTPGVLTDSRLGLSPSLPSSPVLSLQVHLCPLSLAPQEAPPQGLWAPQWTEDSEDHQALHLLSEPSEGRAAFRAPKAWPAHHSRIPAKPPRLPRSGVPGLWVCGAETARPAPPPQVPIGPSPLLLPSASSFQGRARDPDSPRYLWGACVLSPHVLVPVPPRASKSFLEMVGWSFNLPDPTAPQPSPAGWSGVGYSGPLPALF